MGAPRIRRNEEDSKRQLIDATLDLVSKHGWENFSMRKLAAKCGMSPSNIVYHFESNEALMIALLNKISLNNFAIVEKGRTDEMGTLELLMNHFRGNLEWVDKNPSEAHIVLLIYSRAPFDKDFAKVFELMVNRAQERLAAILTIGVNKKELRIDLDVADLAETIHQLLLGASIYQLSGRKLKDTSAHLSKIESTLTRFLF